MVQVGGKNISINPRSLKSLIGLMDRSNEFDGPYLGKNQDNENVIVYINDDNVTTETLQNNGYTRVNVYWRDGTSEEIYEK